MDYAGVCLPMSVAFTSQTLNIIGKAAVSSRGFLTGKISIQIKHKLTINY
jgi:hypothetical protein